MVDTVQRLSGLVLGHHPLLSIAEVLAQTNNTTIRTASEDSLVIDTTTNITLIADYLGGIQKVVVDMEPCLSHEILACAAAKALAVFAKQRQRKVHFTVSCYGAAEGMQKNILKHVKRALADAGALGRFLHKDMQKNVPNVLVRNQVLGKGVDIVVMGSGDTAYVGTTSWVQDVDMYVRRDIDKPRRDMQTGMLPPKLAQTLINLALPHVQQQVPCVWDPFCGLGVIPMEAILMGFPVVASDINPEMEDNTHTNLTWLTFEGTHVPPFSVSTIDAAHWSHVPTADGLHPNCIVTEGTLGHNFLQPPTEEEALYEQEELARLYEDFFQGLSRPEAQSIEAVVMTIPFHITASGKYLRLLPKVLPAIYALGFTTAEILPVGEEALRKANLLEHFTEEHTILYTRSKQFVGREIVVFTRA